MGGLGAKYSWRFENRLGLGHVGGPQRWALLEMSSMVVDPSNAPIEVIILGPPFVD